MLATQARSLDVVDKGGADVGIFIGGDAHADAGFADEDAEIGVSGEDLVDNGAGVVGVVDGVERVTSEVFELMPVFFESAKDNGLKVIASVVGSDGDFIGSDGYGLFGS